VQCLERTRVIFEKPGRNELSQPLQGNCCGMRNGHALVGAKVEHMYALTPAIHETNRLMQVWTHMKCHSVCCYMLSMHLSRQSL
jgi:hypothetical protein